ncbi:cytochrome, chloroplastic [Raphidocelis subcapitata]|uniref:Cytochrome c-553 n=1 Tax=Raphidocelis subcapitata TaxID=307507 RepID=A0A2V0NQ75_9CHLO|nr:cytochrome, chloroplastic [Raphidocelis subcapitata]|eukprot:GBF89429.1 cytochrome, chloroplastic [Raphidocelis subcapitata]
MALQQIRAPLATGGRCAPPRPAARRSRVAARAAESEPRMVWGGALRLAAAAAAAAALAGCGAAAPPPAVAAVTETFAAKCAGCHMNGGNVLQAGATLFTEDLQRNGRADPEGLYQIVYSGKGKMPGFGTECAPKGACTFGPRLSDEEVREMADYVAERAAAAWK